MPFYKPPAIVQSIKIQGFIIFSNIVRYLGYRPDVTLEL